MRILSFWQLIVAAILSLMLSGCFYSNSEDIIAFTKPYEKIVTDDNYVLLPPDEVEIHCASVPEIHLQRQIIRPDGRVSFEKLGEFDAAGKKPAELSEAIRDQATRCNACLS